MRSRTLRRALERRNAKVAAKAPEIVAVQATQTMSASVGSSAPSLNNDAIRTSIDFAASSEPFESRPISESKLLANRRNAEFSTGPKTEAGRRASSRNALRHGLTAHAALLPSDDAAAYQDLVQSHVDRYFPATDEENELVQLIADTLWRLLKVAPLEAGMFAAGRLEHGEALFPQEKDSARRRQLIDGAVAMLLERPLKNLHLQERRLRNQHASDIAKLKELQTARLDRERRAAEKNTQIV